MLVRSLVVTLLAFSFAWHAWVPRQTRAAARDVQLFLIADTDDMDINDDVFADQQLMTDVIEAGVASARKYVKFHGARPSSGSELLAQIKQELRSERAAYSSDDAIVIYFSGHGEVRAGEHGLLLNRGRENEEFVPRSRLLREVRNFDPALFVLITDSCAKRNGDIRRDAVATRAFTNPLTPLMRTLFFEAHGIIDINSCQPGQAAWPSTQQNDAGDRIPGSLFTMALTSTLEDQAQTRLTWDEFLPIVYKKTNQLFQEHYPGGEEDEYTGAFQSAQTPVTFQQRVEYHRMSFGIRVPLGVTVQTCPHGVHVTEVKPNSPASRLWNANLQNWDALRVHDHILMVNRQPVQTYEATVGLIRETKDEIHLLVKRGDAGDACVLVAELTDGGGRQFPRRAPLGVHLMKCPKGVHIHALDQGSPATRGRNVETNEPARLTAGDHIVSINGNKVESDEATLRLLNKANGKLTLRIRLGDTKEEFTFVTELYKE